MRIASPAVLLRVLATVALLSPWCSPVTAQLKPDVFQALSYRYVGPIGNRVVAVAGVPGDPNIIYAGAATGGVWKTSDAGVHWKPIFDEQDVQSIGAIAVSPADPNIIWVGTGEAFIRGSISIGNGVYKSTDGGESWTHVGLEKTGRIARVVADPRNPDIAYVAAMGTCYGPQQERGLYRTEDGGHTWQRVLFVDENTGAADVSIDPSNSHILMAAMWQVLIRPWDLNSGGPGSGIYISRDGGTSWKHLVGHGLPSPPLGRIGVAFAPSQPERIYTLIETAGSGGVLWRSDDEGENWTLVSHDHRLNVRPHYFSRLAVMPDNPDEIWFATIVPLMHSIDGGITAKTVPAVMPDNHDIWIDPANPKRILVANDRYVNISNNRGRSWMRVDLPNAQIYHVAADDQIPYFVYGNRQDGPAFRCPSNSLDGTQILPADCTWTGGAESGWTLPDPADANLVWTSGMGGFLQHLNVHSGHAREVNPWPDEGWPAANQKYRFQWTYPLALSPHNPHRLYVGSQYVMESDDDGQSWKTISPDLTLNDKSKQHSSGGLSPDNTGVEVFDVVFAIAESPVQPGLIWAGTNDGQIQVTRDGGQNWINVTRNIHNLPPFGAATSIEPSHFNAGTAYVTIDRHQMDDRAPYVYMTSDYGASWRSIDSDLPRSMFSYAACIREDPVRKGLLYLGIENGIYVSLDGGAHWTSLQQNLPYTRVSWITVQRRFDDLVVSTYGRGIWIMDDIKALQQLTPAVLSSNLYLFPLRPAYRFLMKPVLPMYMGEADDAPTLAGKNPPYGADFTYYLGQSPDDKTKVQIDILDSVGQVIRTLTGTKKKGMNRVWWDLRYENSKVPLLRTEPIGAPWFSLGAKGSRDLPAGVKLAPVVPPGNYTVRLRVGITSKEQSLTVLKDPHSPGTQQDILAQTKMELGLRDLTNTMASIIDQIESTRQQIESLEPALKTEDRWKPLESEASALDTKLLSIEEALFDPHATEGDPFYYPPGLYSKVASLATTVCSAEDYGPNQIGDDSAPTAAEQDVFDLYRQEVSQLKSKFDQVMQKDLAEFNARLKKANVPSVGFPAAAD